MKNEELMRLLARRQKRNRKLLTAGRFLIGILFFAIWELCARFGIINDLYFPELLLPITNVLLFIFVLLSTP